MTSNPSLPTDFTIAEGIHDPQLLESLQQVFERLPARTVELSRLGLEDELQTGLTQLEAEHLFTGLVLNDAAEQVTGGTRFSEYTFRIETRTAATVLQEQRIARAALDSLATDSTLTWGSEVQLAATLPPELRRPTDSSVVIISEELRQLFFDADDIVRIANPYFDPAETIVGDLASLPSRGVETRILTRETSSAAGPREVLNNIFERIPESRQRLLEVRDLFRRDSETGRQAVATHAKVVIADEELCYIGSANLTRTSLSSNFELGVILQGGFVSDIARVFDQVFESGAPVRLPV